MKGQASLFAIALIVLCTFGCVSNSDMAIRTAARHGDAGKIQALLADDPGLASKTIRGRTPLHDAAMWGQKEVAALLLARGADVNARDFRQRTPLHLAAIRGQKEMVEFLLANGADPNATDSRGRTPLDLCWLFHKSVADVLRQHRGQGSAADSSPPTEPANAPLAPGDGDDIVALVRQKKVEVRTQGSGIEGVTLQIRRLVNSPLLVRIPVGTFFVSAKASSQNMVVTAECSISLTTDQWQRVTASAACANRPRHIPGAGDSFSIQASPHQKELAVLMPVLNKANADYATRQAAVWIVTDNANYQALGILVSRPAYSAYGGTRVIHEAEAARAMKICEEAGIRIRYKAIWRDRLMIARSLNDGELKSWLEGPR